MDDKTKLDEKIIFEDDLPPLDEPAVLTHADATQDFVKEDDRKLESDKGYQKQGHGTVLLQEDGPKNQALENAEYYKQGYQGQKKDEMGKEKAQGYEKDREIDTQGRQLAPVFVQEKTQAPEKGPRKQKQLETEKPDGNRVVENLGSKKYPERLALPSGKISLMQKKPQLI